ncbi:MAG: YciI family protein [bacterium]
MKYLTLVYGNEEIWSSLGPDVTTLVAEVDAFNRSLRESGELVDVQGLGERPKAVHAGASPVLTDGPYLEAKEHIGSYFVLDVATDERAQEIARSCPGLRYGTRGGLELWPLMPTGDVAAGPASSTT